MSETEPVAEEILTDEETQAHWQGRYTYWGYLADDNVEHVLLRLKNLIGDRSYTFVTQNSLFEGNAPEVRASNRVTKDGFRFHRMDEDGREDKSCSIGWSDDYYSTGVHSWFATEREANKAASDPKKAKQTTYFMIEGGRAPDDIGKNSRVEFKQYAPGGNLIWWVIAPEHERNYGRDYWKPEQVPVGSTVRLGHPSNNRLAVVADTDVWIDIDTTTGLHPRVVDYDDKHKGRWSVLYVPTTKEN